MKKILAVLFLALGVAALVYAYDQPFQFNTAGSTVLSATGNKLVTGIVIDSVAGTYGTNARIMLFDSATAPANITITGTPVWSATYPVSPTSSNVGVPIKLNLVVKNGLVVSSAGSPVTFTGTAYADNVGWIF